MAADRDEIEQAPPDDVEQAMRAGWDVAQRLAERVRTLEAENRRLLLLLDSIGQDITDTLGGRDMDALRRASLTGSTNPQEADRG